LNRSDAESNFDDALGRRVRWSLRGSVANAAPSAEVWARINQQVYAAESAAAAMQNLTARPRGMAAVRERGRMRAAAGRLLRLGAATLRILDEHTMSSEIAWRPETEIDVRCRLALQCISSLPLCGQMLASY
jgi:hypothetical protein